MIWDVQRGAFLGCLGGLEKKEATQRGKTASPLSLVTVLTTVTENREQEVMLSSPVSLAPLKQVQSECHDARSTHFGYVVQRFIDLSRCLASFATTIRYTVRVKST